MNRIVLLSTSAVTHPGPAQRWIPLLRDSGVPLAHTHFVGLHPHFTQVHTTTDASGMHITHVAQMHGSRDHRPYTGGQLLRIALLAAIQLARTTMHIAPHTIVICKAQPINGLAALLVRRWHGSRLVLDADDDEVAAHGHAAPWVRALLAWWQRRIPQQCQSVSVASTALHRLMTTSTTSPVMRIPNGVGDAAFIPPSIDTLMRMRRTYQLPAEYLCYCGTIAADTHASDLLVAAEQLRHGEIPLVIAGTGRDLHALQHIPQRRPILWLGAVPAADIPAMMYGATATIDPVRDTPVMRTRCPLKITESLAQGVPVISADVGDRAELIGTTGQLIPPDSAAALATAMDQAQRLPDVADRCRQQAQHLHWRNLAPRWAQHHQLNTHETTPS